MSDKGRFVWHELMTKDPAAAQEFYKHVVGWTTSKWDGGMDYTMWLAGEKPVGGVMDLPREVEEMGAPPHWLTYVGVADVDATLAQAEKLGGETLVPGTDIEGVGRFGVLRDPQGAVIAIMTGNTELPAETDPGTLEFSWHELVTTDYKQADRFYNQLFGWDKKDEFDMGEMGMYHMFGRDRFTYGGMYNKPADMPAPANWLPYVSVDSADDAAERAQQKGGTVLHGPMEVPGGDRIAILTDPQGAAFAVHSKKQ